MEMRDAAKIRDEVIGRRRAALTNLAREPSRGRRAWHAPTKQDSALLGVADTGQDPLGCRRSPYNNPGRKRSCCTLARTDDRSVRVCLRALAGLARGDQAARSRIGSWCASGAWSPTGLHQNTPGNQQARYVTSFW